jgi:hypothetical protein
MVDCTSPIPFKLIHDSGEPGELGSRVPHPDNTGKSPPPSVQHVCAPWYLPLSSSLSSLSDPPPSPSTDTSTTPHIGAQANPPTLPIMNSLTGDHDQSFVNLDDDHHNAQTDAEALEAIRVAIGQSTDFNSEQLPDVLQGLHDEHTLDHHAGQRQAGNESHSAPGTTSEVDVQVDTLEQGLRLIQELADNTIKTSAHISAHGSLAVVASNSDRISYISKALTAMLHGSGLDSTSPRLSVVARSLTA